jgi:hypothetical protein
MKIYPYQGKTLNNAFYLPALSTFLGELGEDNILIWVLLLVFLPTGLNKKCIGSHTTTGFIGVSLGTRHFSSVA